MEKHPAGDLRKLHERTGEEKSRPAICNRLAPQTEYIDVPRERQRVRQARGVLIFRVAQALENHPIPAKVGIHGVADQQ